MLLVNFRLSSSVRIADPKLRTRLEAIVYNGLRPVAGALGGLYAFFAVSHWYVLPPTAAVPMTVIAALSALAFFLLRGLLVHRPLPVTYASPLGAAIAMVTLLNRFTHLALLPEPHYTTNLVLVVIGAGCFFFPLNGSRWCLRSRLEGGASLCGPLRHPQPGSILALLCSPPRSSRCFRITCASKPISSLNAYDNKTAPDNSN